MAVVEKSRIQSSAPIAGIPGGALVHFQVFSPGNQMVSDTLIAFLTLLRQRAKDRVKKAKDTLEEVFFALGDATSSITLCHVCSPGINRRVRSIQSCSRSIDIVERRTACIQGPAVIMFSDAMIGAEVR